MGEGEQKSKSSASSEQCLLVDGVISLVRYIDWSV